MRPTAKLSLHLSTRTDPHLPIVTNQRDIVGAKNECCVYKPFQRKFSSVLKEVV